MAVEGKTFCVTEKWLPVGGSGETFEQASSEAERVETELKAHHPEEYVFAKPIFRGGSARGWQVRLLVASMGNSPVAEARGSPQKKGKKGKSAEPDKSLDRIIHVEVRGAFDVLLKTVEEVKIAIKNRQNPNTKEDSAIRKMDKFVIYLLKTIHPSPDAWPYKTAEGVDDVNASVGEVTGYFRAYLALFGPGVYLTDQNKETFRGFLGNLNRGLRRASMDLEGVGLKITTKSQKAEVLGTKLLGRIQELVDQGTSLIHWKKTDQKEQLLPFVRVLAAHTYSYKTDFDIKKARVALKEAVDAVVEQIAFHDFESRGDTLFNFFIVLLKEVTHLVNVPNSPDLFPLIWMMEALVAGNSNLASPDFISYMRRQGPERFIAEGAQMMLDLFFKDDAWKCVADFIVVFGSPDLFAMFLKRTISQSTKGCKLNQAQTDRIFAQLNRKLQIENGEYKQAYITMYRAFVSALADVNKLHWMKPYAAQDQWKIQLRANLAALGYDCMADHRFSPEIFFGNGTHVALKELKEITTPNPRIAGILMRLFAGYGNHPVLNATKFREQLVAIFSNMNRGYELFCEEVLGQLGALARPEEFTSPVEDWLEGTIRKHYNALRQYVLMSLPLEWSERGIFNLQTCLCMNGDRLCVIDYNEEREMILTDFLDGTPVNRVEGHFLVSHPVSTVTDLLESCMGNPGVTTPADLTRAYIPFAYSQKFEKELQSLAAKILKKMRQAGVAGQEMGTFSGRLKIWVDFFTALAPFFNHLDRMVSERFFPDGKLKKECAKTLVMLNKIEENLPAALAELNSEGVIERSKDVIEALSNLICPLCTGDVDEILTRASLEKLWENSSKFESVVCRRLDDLSYTRGEFKAAFCDNNRESYTRLGRPQSFQDAVGLLTVKERVVTDHVIALRSLDVPIHFLLSNQAIGIELCCSPNFKYSDGREANLVLRFGTGQGKSLVIGVTALEEAKKLQDNNINGRVWMFTSYDHLAKRDHAFAAKLFKDQFGSVCISTVADVANFTDTTKIIYADAEKIQGIVRELTLKLLEDPTAISPREEAFLRSIYGREGEKMITILDEYDLIDQDLESKSPRVQRFRSFLDVGFVSRQQIWPRLANLAAGGNVTPSVSESKIDGSDGKPCSLVSEPYENGEWRLPIAVTRFSKLIERSDRVIGLSGTARPGEKSSIKNPLFFDIPSSHDPNSFGSQFDPEETGDVRKKPISCYRKRKIADVVKAKDANGVYFVVSEQSVTDYCRAIADDIRMARLKSTGGPTRPVLIFADPHFRYASTQTPDVHRKRSLWTTLTEYLRREGLDVHPLVDTDPTKDLSDAELQQIAKEGVVTITTIKYGRGADIRVSHDIKEGLHVIVGLRVFQQRMLEQLIGRTGRMGRFGSWSGITLGDLVKPDSNDQDTMSKFYGVLHELTKLFIFKVLDNKAISSDVRKQWLVFSGQALWTHRLEGARWTFPKLNRDQARRLCGDAVNRMDGQFFE